MGTGQSIRQNNQTESVGNRLTCLTANPVERPFQSRRTLRFGVGDINRFGSPAAIVQMLDRRQFFIRQDWVGDCQPMTLLFVRIQQISFGADVAFQRHDDFFPRAVDRGVGHLCEELLEVVVHQSRMIAHTRQRRIVTHRSNRIFLGENHRNEHELQRFGRITERLHMREQFGTHHAFGGLGLGEFAQQQSLALEPFVIRTPIGEVLLQFFVGNQSTLLKIDQEHLPGLKSALDFDVLGFDIEDTHFTRHDHAIVMRDVIATRSQSVPIQRGTDNFSIRERNRSRTIPGFLEGRVILVERTFVFGHRIVILPRLGNHHHDRFGQASTRHHECFQSIVEVPRIGTVRLDQREQLVQIISKELTLHHPLSGVHPVAVTTNGVDFAVVGDVPLRMSPIPARERVR